MKKCEEHCNWILDSEKYMQKTISVNLFCDIQLNFIRNYLKLKIKNY